MSIAHVARLDLRGAFDFAIMVEEDAQVRYEQLAALLGHDAGGAGDVFRAMAASEAKHRSQLEARRAEVFRAGDPRIEVTVLDAAVERPEVDGELPRTAREALCVALAAERRSFAFYREALAHIQDRAVADLFRRFAEDEVDHIAMLEAKIASVEPAGPAAPPPAPRPAPASPPEAYPDRALLASILPRFDVATQLVATRVILDGAPQDEVAAELGVSRRTVAVKLTRFLAIARQHVAVALAAATLVGCSPGFDGPDALVGGGTQGPAASAAMAAPGSAAPAGLVAGPGASGGEAPAPRAETRTADGAVDPFNRTPNAPELQADGTRAQPQLANVSPASGAPAGGGEVLITGSGFANVQVMFGGVVARVLNQSSNAVTVVAPEGSAGPCPVVVTNRDGAYAVAGSAYTYR